MSTTALGMPQLGPPVPARGCDCNNCDFFLDNPRARQPICSGRSDSCDYCGCARATAATTPAAGPGPCGSCPIRCGSRPDIGTWMSDIGGTAHFDDLQITTPVTATMPRFVPQGDGDDIATLDEHLSWAAYAIGLRRVFSPRSGKIFPKLRGRTAAEAFAAPRNCAMILSGYGLDPLVEAYWSSRHRDEVLAAITAQRWDLVLAPNYSMYLNQPRAEQLINFRRNLVVAAELAAAGTPAAPCLYWARLEDLYRYLDWITETAPAALAINAQTFRTRRDWEEVALPGLTFLAATIPTSIPIWITGLGNTNRLRHTAALFGDRLHVIGQNPLQYARHGKVLTADGVRDLKAATVDAFAHNVRYYNTLLTTATNGDPA